MDVKGLLNAPTLIDAVEYFLSRTDMIVAADEVTSFCINGHEIITTFIDSVNREDAGRKPQAKAGKRLL